MPSGVTIKRTNQTRIEAMAQASGNRVTADHFLWFARLLQEAVDAGMPKDTEVKIRNESGVNGVSIQAVCSLTQEIP